MRNRMSAYLGLEPHSGGEGGEVCVPGVVTATFTGKAALVLRRKGTPARTIHSLIYSVIEATEEEVEAAEKKIQPPRCLVWVARTLGQDSGRSRAPCQS
jgi:hypothetical protein